MNFKQEYYLIYIVISVSAAVILSFLFYRKTILNNLSKFILISLRALALFGILLLLFITYVSITKIITEKPVNIFLFDNSLSMTLENRFEEIKNSESLINTLANNNSENKYYAFSGKDIIEIEKNNIRNLITDSLNYGGTNLAAALAGISEKFAGKKISSVNIFSDGLTNEGGNTVNLAEQTGAMFNYYLIGDTIQKNDLLVKNVFFNGTVYTESNTEILVELNSYNYSKIIKVNLYEDDNFVQSQEIPVTKDKIVYNRKFNIKSDAEGIRKFRVEIAKEPDEITYKNNSEEFFINFINNKFKLLVLSGNPSTDFSYLSGTVKSLNNIEAKYFTQKAPGVFYEGRIPQLDEFNVLMLVNFPNAATDLNSLNNLSDDIRRINIPLIFISGSNTDYEKLKILTDYLPVSSISRNGNEVKSGIKTINGLSPDIAGYFSFEYSFNNLPEIYIPGINFTLKPESRTILYSSLASKPVLVLTGNGVRNSAVFFAYDFYKWRLNNSGSDTKNIMGKIISGIILNISNKESNKKININPGKQVFSPGELIKINCTVNLLDIKGNESVKLNFYNNSSNTEIPVNKTSNNSFSGETKILQMGEYFIKGTLYQNGIEVGQDIKKILIKESEIEYKKTKPENTILENLAGITNGNKITLQNLNILKDKIKQKNDSDSILQETTNKIFLNSSLLLLTAIIIFLTIEWFMRKRLNLP